MASLDYELERKLFIDFYDENRSLLEQVSRVSQTLISQLTTEISGIEVTSRIKDRDECLRKFNDKYRSTLESLGTEYEIKNYITDLIGTRVVCLYEDEVDKVKEILEREFDPVDTTDKISELEKEANKFGYRALHLDLNFNDVRKDLPEYQQIKDFQFEVQIRTIVQDAWSIIDHKINYKRNVSEKKLKRRIIRLAALFELADQEFRYIKDEINQIQEDAKTDSENLETEEKLDVVGMLKILNKNFNGYTFHPQNVDLFIDDIIKLDPQIQPQSLDTEIRNNLAIVSKYREHQLEMGNNLNPYTMIRHILYLADKAKYERALFNLQRNNFDEWLESVTTTNNGTEY